MSWDYAYQAGPAGGTLTDLHQYCTFVRVPVEHSDGFRGVDPIGQFVHGEVSQPRKFHPARDFMIEVGIKGVDPVTNVVTHPDGSGGHYYENISSVKKLLAGTQSKLVRFQRTAPDAGTAYLDCWQQGRAQPSQDRMVWSFPMRAPRPFWVGAADNGNTPPTLTVAGDAPIDDMVIDFTGSAVSPRLTHDDTGDYVEYENTLPAGGVRIDVGAGTCVRITGGADESQYLRVNRPWWLELDPGDNAVTLSQVSGTPSVSVDWFTKWR